MTPKWHLTNWAGYGRPDHKMTLRYAPDAGTVAHATIHEQHAARAEWRLEHEGVLYELELYVAGICREYSR